MKKANELFFSRMAENISANHSQQSKSIKYIRTDRIDKGWLKKCTFIRNDDLIFDAQNFFSLSHFEGDNYFFCVGNLASFLSDDEFHNFEINSGIFLSLINDFNVPMIKAEDDRFIVANEIFIPGEETESIVFNYVDLLKFFPALRCYKLRNDSSLIGSSPELTLQKTSLYALALSENVMGIRISEETLGEIKSIARLDVDFVPFDRIFRAFGERRYEHAFLDLYRCVEMLFSLKKIDEIKRKLLIEKNHIDLCVEIESSLGWRPVERGALDDIFQHLPIGIKKVFDNSFKNDSKPSDNVYDLRNDCVHFRPLQKKSNIRKSVEWIVLIEAMTLAIHHVYNIDYRSIFVSNIMRERASA